MQFVTIASQSYLPRVSALAASIERAYPDASFTWVVSSKEHFDDARNGWIVRHGSAFVDDWERRCLVYDETERATSIKASVVISLLEAGERIVYLDPDMIVHGRLPSVESTLASFGLVLTPHWVSPEESAGPLTPAKLSRVGITNLGFLAASPGDETNTALGWLEARTRSECVRGQEFGVFVDQRWSDFLPHLFGSVAILRDERINVGWWNGHARDWDKALLTHFSGYDPSYPDRPSRHLHSLSFSDLHPTAFNAFGRYHDELLRQEAGPNEVSTPYFMRLLAREMTEVDAPSHPFDTPLGRLLCRTMVQPELSCNAIGKVVGSWLHTTEAERVLEKVGMVETAQASWAMACRKIVCTHPCSHREILAVISGVDRASGLALVERCVCGREKPLNFDRESV